VIFRPNRLVEYLAFAFSRIQRPDAISEKTINNTLEAATLFPQVLLLGTRLNTRIPTTLSHFEFHYLPTYNIELGALPFCHRAINRIADH